MPTTEAAVPRKHPQAAPPREAIQQPSGEPLCLDFKRRYGGLYTNRHECFVLRVEHRAELQRLVHDHNRLCVGRMAPLTMSDLVNAALDVAFEHRLTLDSEVGTEDVRATLGRAIYRKAFMHFLRHGIL